MLWRNLFLRHFLCNCSLLSRSMRCLCRFRQISSSANRRKYGSGSVRNSSMKSCFLAAAGIVVGTVGVVVVGGGGVVMSGSGSFLTTLNSPMSE